MIYKNWYAYKGTGDYFDSHNYRRIAKKSTPSYVNGYKICAVLLKDKALTPSTGFSNELMQYMIDTIAAQLPRPFEKPKVLMLK
ncbi:hypothetical protein AQ505_20925 [Pedobacter sp. PACM 27299]|uniref:hypothetical protein n=1 Tax=Pedobacter sp. PACM 27299 TaxID=1727164 RepID=UPI000705BD11|nr:hypothetical protein [Pedobacter sp. PACM 27299]ALL07740.1 hypothetical protein AQ505_20925 [Pedobacter sp. PACM 27299]